VENPHKERHVRRRPIRVACFVRALIRSEACSSHVSACADTHARMHAHMHGRLAAVRAGIFDLPNKSGTMTSRWAVSAEARALVRCLLVRDPQDRMCASAVRDSPFLRSHDIPAWLPAGVRHWPPPQWPPHASCTLVRVRTHVPSLVPAPAHNPAPNLQSPSTTVNCSDYLRIV
jgi:hypothetical protein